MLQQVHNLTLIFVVYIARKRAGSMLGFTIYYFYKGYLNEANFLYLLKENTARSLFPHGI